MRIIFIGDIVGRSGRDALKQYIPIIKEDFKPDVIIVNAENAAAGYGLNQKIAEEIFQYFYRSRSQKIGIYVFHENWI